ncbi:hypothetical protein ACA910_006291 [Epithemia clementina (nom. ined.)]
MQAPPAGRLPPSVLQPASIQLQGYKLEHFPREGKRDGASQSSFPPWLLDLSVKLKKAEASSLVVDADFIRNVDQDHFSKVIAELEHSSASGRAPTEWHVDLRQLQPQNYHLTIQGIRALTEACKTPSGGLIRKVAVFGLTTRNGILLSALPSSMFDLQLFFQEEPPPETDDEEAEENEQRERRIRVEEMIHKFVAPHISVNCLTIKYDENADDHLPISAMAFVNLLRCPSYIKIELERCSVVLGDEDDDAANQEVFLALRDNTSLFLLRMRSGAIESGLGESIARAIEVGNRSLKYIDMGDMGLADSNAVTALTKAISRNPVLQGAELNLNSIENFHFASLGNLTCVDLSDNYLGDEGALQLAQLIPACSLERMNLADNCIGQIGGCAIAWSLTHNNTLSKINICNNPLFDPEGGDGPRSEVTTRIHNSFTGSPAYQQGFLGMLCASLRHNKILSFINLANTGLDDSHGPLLSILFRVGSLDGIGLLRNNVGDGATIYMCQALSRYRTTLKVLMLEMNPISERGFYAIWKGLLLANDTLISVTMGKQTYMIDGVERGQRDLDIVLKMNRAGMVRLRRDKNATRDQWVDALIELSDDVDCSFTFLVENPFVFNQ